MRRVRTASGQPNVVGIGANLRCIGRRVWFSSALLLLTLAAPAIPTPEYILTETGNTQDNHLTFELYNPNNFLGGDVAQFTVPFEGYVDGTANISASGWDYPYHANSPDLVFTSIDAAANLPFNQSLNFECDTTNSYRAWREITYVSAGAGVVTQGGNRLPVPTQPPPALTTKVTRTNLLLSIATIGGMPYQITFQPNLNTNAPVTVLTNFLGHGSNVVVAVSATNPAAFYRAAILPY